MWPKFFTKKKKTRRGKYTWHLQWPWLVQDSRHLPTQLRVGGPFIQSRGHIPHQGHTVPRCGGFMAGNPRGAQRRGAEEGDHPQQEKVSSSTWPCLEFTLIIKFYFLQWVKLYQNVHKLSSAKKKKKKLLGVYIDFKNCSLLLWLSYKLLSLCVFTTC